MSGAYPTGDELQTYLTSVGVVANDAAMARLNLDAKAAAASDEWERRTNWLPFLGSDEVTRYFDPPRSPARVLELEAGLLTLTSLNVGAIEGISAGSPLTRNQSFWLEPPNAVAQQMPFTHVRFRYAALWSIPHTIAVTGTWGRQAALSEAVWNAVKSYGAWLCYPEIALGIGRGLYAMRDLNFEVRYGGAGITALSKEAEAWEKTIDRVAKSYRRMSF